MSAKRRKPASKNEPSAAPPVRPPAPQEGLKDTTESIVVAFILAFVFRTFMVEAFVIPTGSMAATLYGKHGTLVCEDCGFENAYGLTDPETRAPMYGPQDKVRCQNCGHLNNNLKIHDGAIQGAGRGVYGKGNAEAGDRILVFKWPFDFGFDSLGPHRWDVTVFKNPANGEENFIKRLVGLPDEVLEIIDGDVYSVPTSELSEKSLESLENARRAKYLLRTGGSRGSRELRVPEFVLDELSDKLTIRRKPPVSQEALWTVVYDHDYPPREWDPGQPRWKPVSTDGPMWTTGHRRLAIAGGPEVPATVRFDGKEIVDHNAYNIDVPERLWNPVSDLRFEAVLFYQGGDGWLDITLPKHDTDFTARLAPDGHVSLFKSSAGHDERELLAKTLVPPFAPDRPVEVTFQNVDFRVSLEIDGRELLATTSEQYHPDVRVLRNQRPQRARKPWLTSAGMDLELWHVVLSRDEHYTTPRLDQTRMTGWGTTNNPILIREGEYFMLGDNSPASKDSRLWDQVGPHLLERGEDFQLGTVPEDQLIGRAFFVYWPSGLRPEWLPFLRDYGVIPNVGKMRWIR